jgi:hypothetical protein
MTGRDLDLSAAPPRTFGPLRLVAPPNWTAVVFLAALGCLHLCIAIPAFLNQRWEGYMSLTLACGFLTASLIFFRLRCEISFEPARRRISLRNGIGRFCWQRSISFDDVHAVRLTLSQRDFPRARIEVLCDNEDFECPSTDGPRQEALCLAVLMGVQLIKVYADGNDSGVQTARM